MQPGTRRYRGFEPWELSQLTNDYVLHEHAEAAASQWLLRASAVESPDYDLVDLARLDARVEAQLLALAVPLMHGKRIGVELCAKQLEDLGGRGEVFAATYMAAQTREQPTLDVVFGLLDESFEAVAGPVVSALGWLPVEAAWPVIEVLWWSGDDGRRTVALAGVELHRRDPAAMLDAAGTAGDPRLRARAARSIGELGLHPRQPLLRTLVVDPDDDVRFWAARSLLLLGVRDDEVSRALAQPAESGSGHALAAACLLMRVLAEPGARAWYERLRGLGQVRTAIWGAAANGSPSFVPDLLAYMQDDEHAITAGLAFSQVTGIDLARDDLDRDAEPKPTSDDELDVEQVAGPLPDPSLVAARWAELANSYAPGHRYLAGLPIEPTNLARALRTGRQPQRHAAALELSLRAPGTPLYRTRMSGVGQARELLGWT